MQKYTAYQIVLGMAAILVVIHVDHAIILISTHVYHVIISNTGPLMLTNVIVYPIISKMQNQTSAMLVIIRAKLVQMLKAQVVRLVPLIESLI